MNALGSILCELKTEYPNGTIDIKGLSKITGIIDHAVVRRLIRKKELPGKVIMPKGAKRAKYSIPIMAVALWLIENHGK